MDYEKFNKKDINCIVDSANGNISNNNVDNRVSIGIDSVANNSISEQSIRKKPGRKNKPTTINKTNRTMKSVATTENVPLSHLKICKILNLPGFNADATINWDVLKPEYEKNLSKIIGMVDTSLDTLKKEKLKEDIEHRRLQNTELKKQLIHINDITQFMTTLGIQLNGLMIAKLVKELPPLTTGKSEEEVRYICKGMVNDIVDILKKDINEWTKFNNLD